MEQIVITGGNGFLMKNFNEDFGNEYNVIAPKSNQLDWTKTNGIGLLPNNPDVFIHSAANYGGLVYNQNCKKEIAVDNMKMSVNVLEYILHAKPKKVISIGSACAYPANVNGDLDESQIGTGRMEKTVEMYAFTKYWMLAASEQFLDNWTHLILANMYGPYDQTDYNKQHVMAALIHKFLKAKKENKDVYLLGTGDPTRSLLFVKDAIDVIKHFIDNSSLNAPVNVASGQGMTIKEMAKIISEKIDFQGKIIWDMNKNNNGVERKTLNCSYLDAVYPSRKITTLDEGLDITLKYLKDEDPSLF